MSNHELVDAAKSAVTLTVPHTDVKAAQIGALQKAIYTGSTQDVEAFGSHYRFTPDGDVIKVAGGVEEPAAERIVNSMFRNLTNHRRMEIWSKTASLPHMPQYG